jgi:hypothetical protein|tara:strand:- start:188 stop:832 length:645 start_codon:yes stop_codon:yes gene_type:complete
MTIKLNGSTAGSVALDAPASTTGNADISFKLPIADGSAGQVLQTDGSGNLSWVTLPTGGLPMADQWRVSAGGTLTSDGITDFSANWERGDTNSHGQIGSGMTQSNGIFTFPSTGIYQIIAIMSFKRNSGDNRYANLQMQVTTDNSSYALAADGFAIFPSDYNITNAIAHFLFDVTNTSTHKVKFRAYTNRSSVLFLGNTGYNENSFTFLKLGDT